MLLLLLLLSSVGRTLRDWGRGRSGSSYLILWLASAKTKPRKRGKEKNENIFGKEVERGACFLLLAQPVIAFPFVIFFCSFFIQPPRKFLVIKPPASLCMVGWRVARSYCPTPPSFSLCECCLHRRCHSSSPSLLFPSFCKLRGCCCCCCYRCA